MKRKTTEDIFCKVTIRGVRTGSRRTGWATVCALLDKNAPTGIITRALAAQLHGTLVKQFDQVAGERRDVMLAQYRAHVRGCGERGLNVIVSDELVQRAGTDPDGQPVQMILGRDYMQRTHLTVLVSDPQDTGRRAIRDTEYRRITASIMRRYGLAFALLAAYDRGEYVPGRLPQGTLWYRRVFGPRCRDGIQGRFDAMQDEDGIYVLDVGTGKLAAYAGSRSEALRIAQALAAEWRPPTTGRKKVTNPYYLRAQHRGFGSTDRAIMEGRAQYARGEYIGPFRSPAEMHAAMGDRPQPSRRNKKP